MLQHLYVLFVLAGTSYAAYLDLETSEVPDWVSFLIAGGGLLYYGYQSIAAGSTGPLAASLVSGTALFAVGWTMYLAGMWGGADAFVLGAVGYALPSLPAGYGGAAAPWPFPFSLLMTVFVAGAVYSVAYAAVVAARTDGFVHKLGTELDRHRKRYAAILLLYTAVAGISTLGLYTAVRLPLLTVVRNFAGSLLLLAGLLALAVFLRTVEHQVMEREIPVSELQAGDVLGEPVDLDAARADPAESVSDRVLGIVAAATPFSVPRLGDTGPGRIAGLTEEQVDELQEKQDTVTVRTGVRFVPAFPAAVLFLLLVGDPVYVAVQAVL